MKHFNLQLIKDYAIVGLSYIAFLIVLRPVFFGEYNITDSLIVVTIVHTLILAIVFFTGETVVSYLFKRPFSYSDSIETRFQHFVLCAMVCVPVMMILLTQANGIMTHGFEHADYVWHDNNGSFTLKWVMVCRSSCVVAAFIMAISMTALSEVRQMRYALDELLTINRMLEEQDQNQSLMENINTNKEVVLNSDNRDALALNPHDILYVESAANYLIITYFKDSELCQKRLRSSLKDAESTLKDYPFIVHIHRAFLVNINFITEVTGNAAGYKLHLFNSDKILPVSKANVAMFKQRIMNPMMV